MFSLDLGNLLVHLKCDDQLFSHVERALDRTQRRLGEFGRALTTRVTLPLAAIGTAGVVAWAKFDSAMAKSLAIMQGITPQMRRAMESVAIELSKKHEHSATELAQAYFYLASAGLDAMQSMKALPVVTEFATAGNFDLARATWLLAGSQGALGLRSKDAAKNMENMAHVGGLLTRANTLANATIEQFAEALGREAGAAMKNWNIQLEEGIAILAAYADQMVVGEKAGSDFGRLIRTITKAYQDNRGVWREAQLELFDEKGYFRLTGLIEDMTHKFANLAPEQKAAALSALGFQARIQQVILPLIGASDSIKEYTRVLQGAGGFMEDVAQKNMKNMWSWLKTIWNQLTIIRMEIGRTFSPTLQSLGTHIENLTKIIQDMSPATKSLFVDLAILAAMAGPVALGLSWMIKGLKLLAVAMTANIGLSGLLSKAFIAAFVAIAAYKIGKWFYTEFAGVQKIAIEVAYRIGKAWEWIKFEWHNMTSRMEVLWENFASKVSLRTAKLVAVIAKTLGSLGLTIGSGLTEAVAELEKSDGGASLEARLAENQMVYGTNLASLINTRRQALEEIDEKFAKTEENVLEGAAESTEGLVNDANKLLKTIEKWDVDLKSLSAEQLEAYRSILGEMGRMTEENYKLTMEHIERIAQGYRDQGVNEELVNDWLREQSDLLEIARLKEQGLREGFRAFAMETDMTFTATGERAYDFMQSMQDEMGNGLENMLRDWRNWKNAIIDMFNEIYIAMMRKLFINPLVEGLSGGIAAKLGMVGAVHNYSATEGSYTGSYLPGGSYNTKGLASGGMVWHPMITSVAEKEPELITPLSKLGSLGGSKVEVFNQTSTPIQATDVSFDPERMVTNIILKDQRTNGPIYRSSRRR